MLFALFSATGMQIGEALGMQIGKHSGDFSTLYVRQKVWHGTVQPFLKTQKGDRDIDLHTSIATICHDNHRRLCRVYGWEEKKNKASSGGTTVDYNTIAANAIHAMNPSEAHHFLIVCSLVSDLYCPGFNPRQPLAKDTNLALTASHYKFDTAKLAVEARAELTGEKKRVGEKAGTTKTTKGAERK